MAVVTKTIGRLPMNMGAFDPNKQGGYGKKNRVILYGCEWESKVENNTYAPATLINGVVTPDTTHWMLTSGVPGNYGLDSRVSSLEAEVGTGGSVDTRIASAKSEILGDAGTDYNTLGKCEDKIQANANDIDDLEALVPTQATSTNQLADKNFVNSSISTATATFRGTSATGLTEQQFLTWANGLTKDANDYVFWNTTDSAGNTLYKRYKYDGTQWAFEYTLNNSSFTSAQWAAIQSGITSALTTKLSELPTNSELEAEISDISLNPIDINSLTPSSTFAKNDVIGINGILYKAVRNTSTFPVTLVVQDNAFVYHEIDGARAYVVSDTTVGQDWIVWMDASVDYSINSKQDKLTFDNAPTANSSNPVKSGGVKAALDTKANSSDVTTLTSTVSSHTSNSDIHVTASDKTTWNGKQDAISNLSTIESNANNGNTAYGWGNHANAGYASSSDLTTHTGNGDIHVTAAQKTTWSGKQDTISDLSTIRSGASAGATAYQKPSGGIPKTDLASAVQTSLGKADTALQSHQDISGKADLDANGKVLTSQLPSYVDDVLEYASTSAFPSTGETGKIYVAVDTNLTYRWSGSAYVEISPSLALGETSSTAYRGDKGATAYSLANSALQPGGIKTINGTSIEGSGNQDVSLIIPYNETDNTILNKLYNGYDSLPIFVYIPEQDAEYALPFVRHKVSSGVNYFYFAGVDKTPTGKVKMYSASVSFTRSSGTVGNVTWSRDTEGIGLLAVDATYTAGSNTYTVDQLLQAVASLMGSTVVTQG